MIQVTVTINNSFQTKQVTLRGNEEAKPPPPQLYKSSAHILTTHICVPMTLSLPASLLMSMTFQQDMTDYTENMLLYMR